MSQVSPPPRHITRRALLTHAAAGGAAATLWPLQGLSPARLAQAMGLATVTPESHLARGVVYDDRHARGRRDASTPGIPNVRVSNGRQIVHTDARGRYEIPIEDGQILFVIKPSGWRVPLSPLNLPQFYYIHRPAGSPAWRPDPAPVPDALDPKWYYPGVAPTGPLPASIDFPLQKQDEPDHFQVVVFSDTQVSHDAQLDWMARDTVAELIDAPNIAFGLSLGDIVNVGRLEMFDRVNQLQALTGFPWHLVPGNHDQNLMSPGDELADETFKSLYGPTTYAFDYGQASFLMLENILRLPFEKFEQAGDATGGFRPWGGNYQCGLSEAQWQFVESFIATVPRDRMLVIGMHIDLHGRHEPTRAFRKRLMQLISGRPNTLSLSGHTHTLSHVFIGSRDGFDGPGEHHHYNAVCVRGAGYRGAFDEQRIPHTLSPDGTPNGYTLLSLRPGGYQLRYKASRRSIDYQMNLFAPTTIPASEQAQTVFRANIFSGSQRSTVQMRIRGHSDWLPMTLKPQVDPHMQWVWDTQHSDTPWLGPKFRGRPGRSSHIWEAPLPADLNLPPGTYALQVRTTDMFGQEDQASTPFRILPSS